MPDIQPVILDSAGSAGPILENIKKQMGSIPNIIATLAHSPAVLEGFLAFSGVLASGALSAPLRKQIALAVAGENRCDYCESTHSMLAIGAGVDKEEASNNLRGAASDPRTQVTLGFALSVVMQRGTVASAKIATLRALKFVTQRSSRSWQMSQLIYSPTISIMRRERKLTFRSLLRNQRVIANPRKGVNDDD